MDFTLLGKAVLAAIGGWLGLRTLPGEERRGLGDMMIGGAISGLAAGRIAWMITSGVNPLRRPLDLLVRGEVHVGFAVLGTLSYLWWAARRDRTVILDRLSVPTLFALAGWHIGCFFRDTCAGTPTDLPWAITIEGSTTGRHPVELYAALIMILAGLALWRARSRLGPGTHAGLALVVLSATRLALHPLRVVIDNSSLWWAAGGVFVALGWLALLRRVETGREAA